MANYKETTASGTSYIRAHTVIINNETSYKHIEFQEEKVVVLDDGETLGQRIGHVASEFTNENMMTAFPILDPETGSETGASSTYVELYAALFSLYMHLAVERDVRVAAEEAAAEAAEAAEAESTPETAAEAADRLEEQLEYANSAVALLEAEAEAARLLAEAE